MAKAALDVLSVLPSPAIKQNNGCADLLGDQLFAYGSGCSIVVLEVQQLRMQLVLHGEHRESLVTAIQWAPDCHSRDLKTSSHLRLASGDADGRVVVWDVLGNEALIRLSDRSSDNGILNSSSGPLGTSTSVVGLSWVLGQPWLLAVLLAHGSLVLWDTRGGNMIWQREVLQGEPCCCLARDPLDARRLAVCGSAGGLCLLKLTDPQAGKVDVVTYRINVPPLTSSTPSSSGAASSNSASPVVCQPLFSPARDLLFVTLPREIIVFDLELGLPAASMTLSGSKPAFVGLLGVYGANVSHGLGTEGGTSLMYAAHVDGALSAWIRSEGELRFVNAGWFRLTPPIVRGTTNPATLLAAKAQVWPSRIGIAAGAQDVHVGVSSNEDLTRALRGSLLPDRVAPDASGSRDIFGGVVSTANNNGRSAGGSGGATPAQTSDSYLSIISVTSDGRVWKWHAILPPFQQRAPAAITLTHLTTTSTQPAPPPPIAPPPPNLSAMIQLLPGPLSCIGVFPRPILLTDLSSHTSLMTTATISTASSTAFEASSPFYRPQAARAAPVWDAPKPKGCDASVVPVGEVGLLGAGLTITGQLQVFTIQRGQASPLSVHLCLSLSVHKEGGAARGLRWLGRTPRVLTFTCDRVAPSGQGQGQAGQAAPAWHNSMTVTDLRTRRTTPFREIAAEPNRLAGVRTSPSGFHVLLIFRNAPTELWAVGVDPPIKLMSLDVAWSAPEWISGSDPTNPAPLRLGDLLDVTTITSSMQETFVGMPSPLQTPLQSQLPQAESMILDSNNKAMWGASGGSLLSQASVLGRPTGSMRFPAFCPSAASDAATAPDSPPPPPPYKNPSNTWQATVNEVTAKAPAEYIAYTYDEGIKSGVLRVQGRHVVNDDRVKRPRLPAEESQNFDATAMCGWGSVVVMGDAEGRLAVWSTATGATSLIHTGYGMIRRVYVAPSPHPSLYAAPEKVTAIAARVACLFADGTFGVYELGPRGQLRPGHASPVITSRMFGRVNDICWLPLPCENGSGSVLLALNDTGSLVALDVSQAADRRPSHTHRTFMMRTILSTPSRLQPQTMPQPPLRSTGTSRLSKSGMPTIDDMLGDEVPMSPATPETTYQQAVQQGTFKIVLAAPPPLSCSLLLPRSWALLLRLLLQLGMSEHTLQALAQLSLPTDQGMPIAEQARQQPVAQSPQSVSQQSSAADVWEVVEELMTLLPTATHKALQQALSKPQQQPDSAGATATAGADTAQLTAAKPAAESHNTSSAGAQSEIEEVPEPSNDGPLAYKAPLTAAEQSTGTSLMRAVGDAFKMVRDTTQNLIDDYMTSSSITPPGTPRAGRTAIDDPAAHGKHLHSSFHHDLLGLLQHLAQCRAGGQLLTETEWTYYRAALACGSSSSNGNGKLATALIAHALGTAPPPVSPRLTQPLAFSATAAAAAGSGMLGSTAARVARLCACSAVAAQVSGDREEAAFWTHLPSTLQAVRDLQDSLAPPPTALYQAPPAGSFHAAPGHALAVVPAEPMLPLRVAYQPSAAPAIIKPNGSPMLNGDLAHADGTQPDTRAIKLWDEDTALAEAQERTLWHESLSCSSSAGSEELQERRLLEYVVLGDFQTAVAFLLASTPEACVRYYRDALITAALAAAANMRPGTGVRQLGSALQLQAAKVLSAHAASIGDPLMGVPLHCAAGLYAEAVGLLQECGMWRAAATLTAHALVGAERGQALQRWAEHVAHSEGSVWRAAGILVAAGCCRESLKLLQTHGRPDSAAAFLAACHAAGLTRTTSTAAINQAAGPVSKPPGTVKDPPTKFSEGIPGTGIVQQEQQQTAALQTRTSATNLVQSGASLAPRLSLSKTDILQQQVLPAGDDIKLRSCQPDLEAVSTRDSDTEAILSRTLSTGWASSTCVRVFSVLSSSQLGQESAAVGSQQDMQQDDASPVQLQFERFVTDLLQHM